jgi:hypothetical protein
MRGILLSTATTMAVMLLPLVGHAAELDALTSLNLEVPSSDATFPDGARSRRDERQLPRLPFRRSPVEST